MKLYPHQEQVLQQTADLNRVAYYLDMGLGKTFVGSEKLIQLDSRVNLIVCQKSKVKDWIQHFDDNYEDVLNYDLTNKKFFETFLEEIKELEEYEIAVAVINYELAWRRPELLKLKDFSLMLDESSLIQNRTAKQTKFILKLQPENVILLSGTPTAGKYENLWSQCHLLGWDISKSLYDKHYVNWKLLEVGGKKIKTVDRSNPYKNVERLKSKLREHGAVFMKTEECFDLPEQTFIEVNVPKSKEYNKFMKDSIIAIDGVDLVGDTTLTKHLYARQLCGHYNKAKLESFRNLVESTNDRLIVFYNFKAEASAILKVAHELERPVSVVSGDLKILDAYEQFEDSITMIQYQAGAMGLNLQKANKIIYFTLPERSELFEQSKKRIHRIGQNKPCYYYILTCANSIEKDIYNTLKQRKDYTNELFKERKE